MVENLLPVEVAAVVAAAAEVPAPDSAEASADPLAVAANSSTVVEFVVAFAADLGVAASEKKPAR
jgi:hypothetical protein